MSVNKVTILGNLGRDPETHQFASGDKVTNLRVATSEKWKDRTTGEKRERTEWHSVQVFGPLAEVAQKYLRKGSKVYIEGKLETRKWQDQAGQDRYTTEVVLRGYGGTMVMLGDPGAPDRGAPPPDQSNAAPGGYGRSEGAAPGRDLDDEIPF